jgi:hypothetical protein
MFSLRAFAMPAYQVTLQEGMELVHFPNAFDKTGLFP